MNIFFIMASGGGGSSIIPAGSSGPSFKWLKEWYQGLPPADAEELVKNFNRGSWVTEIGNFDSKHKQHLVKLHEIALCVLSCSEFASSFSRISFLPNTTLTIDFPNFLVLLLCGQVLHPSLQFLNRPRKLLWNK